MAYQELGFKGEHTAYRRKDCFCSDYGGDATLRPQTCCQSDRVYSVDVVERSCKKNSVAASIETMSDDD